MREPCTHDGCNRPSDGRGLCKNHYVARRNRDVRNGNWITVYTDAGPAREHIRTLRGMGIGLRRISELTGLPRITIWHIGEGHRAQIRNRTAKAVLAVDIPTGAHRIAASNAFIDATGSRRRLQALSAIGYSSRHQCRLLGVCEGNLSGLFTGAQTKITAARARRIEALYDKLSMTPGTNQRARLCAARSGWHPPLAWDDDTIDDPTAKPVTTKYRQPRAIDRINEVRDHLGIHDITKIAERLGIQPDTVKQTLIRERRAS